MKIIHIKKVEDCLEGKFVWDILFDQSVTMGFIGHLGSLGKLIYHEFKPGTFWNLIVKGRYTLKGSIGNLSARLLLPSEDFEATLNELEDHISKLN